jgi:hypothetical protein
MIYESMSFDACMVYVMSEYNHIYDRFDVALSSDFAVSTCAIFGLAVGRIRVQQVCG